MTLHTDKELFSEIITSTSAQLGIPEVYIEKDYWVSLILYSLSNLDEEMREKIVFKGGTSLSKAHKLIERFSEDIDLAVIADGLSGHGTKKLLRQIEKSLASSPFEELIEHPQKSKGSEFRKSVHEYPQLKVGDFGDAVNVIILELNTFAHPTPNSLMTINSYIYDFLAENEANDIIETYNLSPFQVPVLDTERTLCEKISAIARASYEGDAELQKKIRHLYDIHLLLQQAEIQMFIASSYFNDMINIVQEDDAENSQFNKAWAAKPLKEAPIFSETSEIISKLDTYYHQTFKSLVYGELPNIEDVEKSILLVKGRLHE